MERLDSMKEPAKWAAAMNKRVEILALVARSVSASPKETWVQRASADYASRLDRLALFLKHVERAVEDLQQKSGAWLKGQELEAEISAAEELVEGYTGRCAIYLLMCSPGLVKELQESSKRVKEKIDALCGCNAALWHLLQPRLAETREVLEQDFPKPSPEDEALTDSLDEGMLDSIVMDSGLCGKLAGQISESLGMPVCSDEFRRELGKLRNEKAAAEARRGKVHSLYLEQFILVLERAVRSASSANSDESGSTKKHEPNRPRMMATRTISGGGGNRDAPMLPLQPFICPITRDVMRDPVQIASGQTYERAAIERWFTAGNTRCPVMGEELPNTHMKSNFALKQSIAEWRDRNYEARLHGVARQLLAAPPPGGAGPPPPSSEREAQVRLVAELRALCEEEPLNKYKVRSMGLIGPMVRLAQESRDIEVRRETLGTLAVLARDNSENQETMVKEGIIEVLVRRLTGQNGAMHEVVRLMRVLSEKPSTAERISHAQGAVVFLVTLLGSEDEDVNHNVKAILENVPMSDENVVIMAEANLASPLAQRLVEGTSDSRMAMAKALARMNLPVASKAAVAANKDVLVTLLKMAEDGSSPEDAREAALGALHNLTSVGSVAKSVVGLGGFKQMERTLSSVKSAERIKIGAARLISRLSAVAGDDWEQDEAMQNELEVYIFKFLQLMGSLTPPTVQRHVLKALIGLGNGKSVGGLARRKLIEQGAFEILLPLLKPVPLASESAMSVRKNAMEMFCLLSREFGQDASSAMKERPEITASLLKTLADDPERTAIVTILASLPKEDEAITAAMHEHNVLPVMIGLLVEPSQDAAATEAAVGAVLRFTSSGIDEQRRLGEAGVVERLVLLLEPGRSMMTRQRAALALADLASSSPGLSQRHPSSGWSSSLLLLCLPCMAPQRPTHRMCRLHMGECGVRSSFCLLEADAVAPLVTLLKESSGAKGDADAAAAALAALATMVGDGDNDNDNDADEGWKFGCQAIDKAKGVPAVIGSVSSVASQNGQRLAITIVERLFNIPEFCARYGASAQMHVIYAVQQGDPKVRRIASRILRRLELIHSQSNYLVGSSTGA